MVKWTYDSLAGCGMSCNETAKIDSVIHSLAVGHGMRSDKIAR